MITNKEQTWYQSSFKEENTILDDLWFKLSISVTVNENDGLLKLSGIGDEDRAIVRQHFGECGVWFVEIM